MKKILLSTISFLALGLVSAQNYSATDAAAFGTWTTYNNDNDTLEWIVADVSASTSNIGSMGECIISNSWTSANGPLTPDNLIVSPEIDMSGAVAVELSYKAGSAETTASGFYEEHYAVYVVNATDLASLLTGTYPTPVFETTLAAGDSVFQETFDVSAVAAGESQVYICFRHYNCTDENFIAVDDVMLTGGFASIKEEQVQVNVYPNPATDILNFKLGKAAESVSIYGVDGTLLQTERINALTGSVDVSTLSRGTYFYEFTTAEGEVITNTFIKK